MKRTFPVSAALAAVLAAALLGGAVSCGGSSGGDAPEVEYENPTGGTEQGDTEQGGTQQPGDTEQTTATVYPLENDGVLPAVGAYTRHRFCNTDDNGYDMYYGEASAAILWGKTRYQQAYDFLQDETQAFAELCQNDPNAATFFTNYDDITNLDHCFGSELDVIIENRYDQYSKFVGRLDYEIDQYDTETNGASTITGNYQNYASKFEACYQRLAEQFYNDSLGVDAKTDSQLTSTDGTAALQEYYGSDADTSFAGTAQQLDALLDLAVKHLDNVPQKATLQKALNLALYTEGLYGLHDMAKAVETVAADPQMGSSCGTGLYSWSHFENKINSAYNEVAQNQATTSYSTEVTR